MALAAKPPLGWNSWNTFSHEINEEVVRGVADAMVREGLKDAGYEYVVIDDCWSTRERDENGRLVPDPEKFPSGMKALADYVHSKGLKFGMYSCAGTHTCAEYPGGFEHEFIDAATYAAWGVDFLKYDYCNKPRYVDGAMLYRRMAMALRNCGRDILFSACNWGHDNTTDWIRSTGAHMYRSTGDIVDSWPRIKELALSQMHEQKYSGPYCFNDMDMLVVGMYGRSFNSWIADNAELTEEERAKRTTEYRTHFSLWAMMNSPLMIGCDVRDMSEETKEILLNRDVLAINQDVEVRTPFVSPHWEDQPESLIRMWKPLENGDYAIGLFNFVDGGARITLPFWDMGLPTAAGYGFKLYDCWKHEEIGVFTERFTEVVEEHGCRLYRATLVKV